MQETVFIGVGSNLNSPIEQVESAFVALSKLANTRLLKQSSLYQSAPMGPQDQDDYINAVAAIKTDLAPLELLDELQEIESQHGRIRKAQQWGPRTLDLDLLLFGNQSINTDRLRVPHYGMHERAFVIYPLLEIAPNASLPDGTLLSRCTETLTRQGIQKL